MICDHEVKSMTIYQAIFTSLAHRWLRITVVLNHVVLWFVYYKTSKIVNKRIPLLSLYTYMLVIIIKYVEALKFLTTGQWVYTL